MVRNNTQKFFTRKLKTGSYPAGYKDGETISFAINKAAITSTPAWIAPAHAGQVNA